MIIALTVVATVVALTLLVRYGARVSPRWAPLVGFLTGLAVGGGFILLGGLGVVGGIPIFTSVVAIVGVGVGRVATQIAQSEEAGRWAALFTWLGGLAAVGLLSAALLVDCSVGGCPFS